MDQLLLIPYELILLVISTSLEGLFQVFEKATRRIYSCYLRTLEDLLCSPVTSIPVFMYATFFFTTPPCPRKIITERLSPNALPSAQSTRILRDVLLSLSWTVGDEERTRQWIVHYVPNGDSTLLSHMR